MHHNLTLQLGVSFKNSWFCGHKHGWRFLLFLLKEMQSCNTNFETQPRTAVIDMAMLPSLSLLIRYVMRPQAELLKEEVMFLEFYSLCLVTFTDFLPHSPVTHLVFPRKFKQQATK